MSKLINIITAEDLTERNRSLDAYCRSASLDELLAELHALDQFRRASDNLYERVRALFFLYAIHRFHLPTKKGVGTSSEIPFEGYSHLLQRRFEEAINSFLAVQQEIGPNDGVSSALASAYHSLGFQTLADQVRHSVRSARGNQWMFRIGHPADHPLRIQPALLARASSDGLYPIIREATPVRMDLTHSGWSDIFFLGMDFPEGARVINTSINLAVRGADGSDAPHPPRPPIETYFRLIEEPVIRLTSIDLDTTADIQTIAELFDFAKDYLGLLKAAVIASGLVPPGMEGAHQPLADLLTRLIGPGYGFELVSQVNGIPKGSRLAVSTNLLASLIAVCMRATGQTAALTGPLQENERRHVAARAILGEWLAGSGGGWQDSGGVWPGMKLIQGAMAQPNDPEYGVSKGRLLPTHHIFGEDEISAETRQKLTDSLVLVHGGMAQDVGPILEMVTEKYLLRSEAEWAGRQEAIRLLDEMVAHLKLGDVAAIGQATTQNFFGPITTIIPWATNLFTEQLVEKARTKYGGQFWGFWMLGGMAGGGMGFLFDPAVKLEAQQWMQTALRETKQQLEKAVPFAMEPVVYDFAINEAGTAASWLAGNHALMSTSYYTMMIPKLLRQEARHLSPLRRRELDLFGAANRTHPDPSGVMQALFERLLPQTETAVQGADSLPTLLEQYGFDHEQHEQIRTDLRSGRIGLAQNRLPVNSQIEDVRPGDLFDATAGLAEEYEQIGLEALADGQVAVVTLAGGAGSRWTQGAGVVKALNPFVKLAGQHRNFLEIHLAKSRRTGRVVDQFLPHIITTSYLTHRPIEGWLAAEEEYDYPGLLVLSVGQSVGLRLIPMARDLRYAWEEMPQQLLDEQAQKVQDSLHKALINWATEAGQGSDYTDNLPLQCLHPVGHWYEVPNLLLNGRLADLLAVRPHITTLFVHNVDTLGANVDPTLLGYHLTKGGTLTAEVITRRLEDRGGGLARVDGQLRLIEGLALPREELEFDLSYYNTNSMWINVDQLLGVFGLTRADLEDQPKVSAAVRTLAGRMPTYITLKEVKKRWGKGQEDVFPVTQFEKLWGDMTILAEVDTQFVVVPRLRGQQLKEVAQLDGWLRDGSAAYVQELCTWE